MGLYVPLVFTTWKCAQIHKWFPLDINCVNVVVVPD